MHNTNYNKNIYMKIIFLIILNTNLKEVLRYQQWKIQLSINSILRDLLQFFQKIDKNK